MGVLVLVVTGAILLLFGSKILSLLGFFAACVMFSFPIGLIGMVAIGVSLTLLLAPRNFTD